MVEWQLAYALAWDQGVHSYIPPKGVILSRASSDMHAICSLGGGCDAAKRDGNLNTCLFQAGRPGGLLQSNFKSGLPSFVVRRSYMSKPSYQQKDARSNLSLGVQNIPRGERDCCLLATTIEGEYRRRNVKATKQKEGSVFASSCVPPADSLYVKQMRKVWTGNCILSYSSIP